MKVHGRRRALRTGVVAATALVLAGAAAGAVLEARLDDNVISACRNKSTGVLRVPAAGVACRGNEQPLQWNVRGRWFARTGGPTRACRAGRPDRGARAARRCTTVSGLPGVAPRPNRSRRRRHLHLPPGAALGGASRSVRV